MQWFGMFPIQGILSGDFRNFKFKLFSLHFLHWLINVISFFVLVISNFFNLRYGKVYSNLSEFSYQSYRQLQINFLSLHRRFDAEHDLLYLLHETRTKVGKLDSILELNSFA